MDRKKKALSLLIAPGAAVRDAPTVARTIARFPNHLLDRCIHAGIRIRLLDDGEQYRDASTALRRLGIDVDRWPVPPAGLFVVEERSVYLRSRCTMTTAHEFAHAIDCALGEGQYLSSRSAEIRAAYARARAFVTPYAASAVDEYFAEGARAMVRGNTAGSPWPPATPARLRAQDPELHRILSAIFAGASA